MIYREYYTKEEWWRIVNTDHPDDPDIRPHCNAETFHVPGTCPFCDGHYRRHPSFVPAKCEPAEANGWGGNMAPKMDDQKAAEEQKAWDEWTAKMLRLGPEGLRAEEADRVRTKVRQIVAKFTKGRMP